MHRCIVVMAILLSACRLMEEPIQQVKSALVSDDIVFDAQDLSKTAVMRCNDNGCGEKTPLSYTLHQVTLSDEEIAGVLQFDNLHVSFEADNKHYTCLRASVPLGRMTLLWRENDDKHCYKQEKAKDYVQQFAAACVKEADWQLVPEVGLKKFACKKDSIEISSACFVAGQSCDGSSWPTNIKGIHDKMGGGQKLKDVKIMAEWKLAADGADCRIGDTIEFSVDKSNVKKSKEVTVDTEDEKLGDVFDDIHCEDKYKGKKDNDINLATLDFGLPGVCVSDSKKERLPENLDACGKDGSDYIKITFEAKE